MRNIKAGMFDLDGTLLDTLESLWYCSSQMLIKQGLKTLPMENYRYYVGDGARVQIQRVLKDSDFDPALPHEGKLMDPHDPGNLDYFLARYMEVLNVNGDYNVKPFDGIMEVLREFKKRDMGLAVFSNKPDETTQVLIKKNFGNMFDYVQGGAPGIPKKPDPYGALEGAKAMGVKPEEVIYFGDSNTDMQTGKNAGMYTVGVLWGFRDKKELVESGADVVISKPLDILDLI